MKTATVLATVYQTAQATCSASPATISSFDTDTFAGNWHMQSSTFYNNDEIGCIKLSISTPNENDKLDAALRSVQLFGLNPF